MREHEVSVFEIERFAIHDGPGIRTTIFLQGCPLRCEWCANPESQSVGIFGKIMNCEELYQIIIRDKDYYEESGGGLTLSGGEPLLQLEQIMPLLIKCRKQGIHIAVETCGCVSLDKIRAVYPVVDLFLFDIKSLEAEKLKKYTGGDMKIILAGFEMIAGMDPDKLVIRVPVLPGFNYSEKEINDIFEFALKHRVKEVDLLPYHTFGINKYEQLGRSYQFACRTSLHKRELNDLKKIGERRGLIVKI